MGKKKQRKGAPDLDNDFPEPAETDESVDVDSSEIQASAPRKQDKKKKAKKVYLFCCVSSLVGVISKRACVPGKGERFRLGLG